MTKKLFYPALAITAALFAWQSIPNLTHAASHEESYQEANTDSHDKKTNHDHSDGHIHDDDNQGHKALHKDEDTVVIEDDHSSESDSHDDHEHNSHETKDGHDQHSHKSEKSKSPEKGQIDE
tara:strand:+ start:2763 stop:3128 length:366 start_codon:yes stop_codon:yes gene_type:complete